jgi:hypothetical protein
MIHLALTHDWELRGDGSGDIEAIQFAPMRRLLDIYAKYGARTTIMPDVMQQVTFRHFEREHPELKAAADSWDKQARNAFRQGHDIQLHLHSQWSDASYENRKWELRGEWSLLKYDRDRVALMIDECKTYLETLLRPLDSNYGCVAFRGSALAIAPSAHLLSTLAAAGIEIDVSVAAGVYLNNATLQLDYRDCDETFLPYYPQMTDARRMSPQREAIVCVPLNHFYGSRTEVTKQNLALARNRLRGAKAKSTTPVSVVPRLDSEARGLTRIYEKLIEPALKRKYFVSDTSRLNYPLMREMLLSMRRRAGETGLEPVPVVITNHPKDMRDWDGLERFIGELANANDIKFVTLREIAEKLRTGEFQARMQT